MNEEPLGPFYGFKSLERPKLPSDGRLKGTNAKKQDEEDPSAG